jgi:hypothetical protein
MITPPPFPLQPLGHWCNAGALHPCESGRYGPQVNQTNAASCAVCSYGHYCGPTPGQAAQQPCKEGFYNDTDGMTSADSCTSCEIGFWCSSGRRIPCARNNYGKRYGNSSTPPARASQQEACSPCASNAETPPNVTASSIADCHCTNGYFRFNKSLGGCHLFPPGAANESYYTTPPDTLDRIRVKPGYWRLSLLSSDIRPCPVLIGQPCRGDLLPSQLGDYCATKVTGISPMAPYCSYCMHHPAEYLDPVNVVCRSCAASRITGVVTLACVLVIAILTWYIFRVSHRLVRLAHTLRVASKRASVVARLKMAMTFYQIVTNLDGVYKIIQPPGFRSYQRSFEMASLNLFAIPGVHIQCFGLSTYFSQLLTRSLLPIVLITARVAYQVCVRRPLFDALPFTLWVSFLVFSLVVPPAVEAFSCEVPFEGDDRSFLTADYTVVCRSHKGIDPEYSRIRVLATATLCIYPLFVCGSYVVLLYVSRSNRRVAKSLAFLVADYKHSCYYWELVETARKLLLTSFFALPWIRPGSLAQVMSALSLQIAFFAVFAFLAPFRRQGDNLFAVCTNACLISALLSCVMLKEKELVDDINWQNMGPRLKASFDINSNTSAAILLISTAVVVLVLLLVFSLSLATTPRLPLFRNKTSGLVVCPPPTAGWHALVSHVWATGQVGYE